MTKITETMFNGSRLIHDGTLTAVIRGLAIDHAQAKVQTAAFADFTDNSSGTAALVATALAIPTAEVDCSVTSGAPVAGFNTNAAKFENACAVMSEHMNNVRGRLGLDIMTWAAGTIASKATIPAQDLTLTGTTGATAIDYGTGIVAMKLMASNIRKLYRGLNECRVALGHDPVPLTAVSGLIFGSDFIMGDVATQANVDTDGTSSITDAVMDVFLTAVGANIATMAVQFNEMFEQDALADLTDNSGGTSEDNAIAAMDLVSTPYEDVSTASAPVAGANTENAKIENNFADLAANLNILAGLNNVTQLIDSTGGSADGTLEIIDDTLTAVDGSGSSTLSAESADVTFLEMAANVATMLVTLNAVGAMYGLEPVEDNSGGTASATGTLVALTDYVGVDNGSAATGVAKVEADAALDRLTDAQATIAAKINEITGLIGAMVQPLHVVAV